MKPQVQGGGLPEHLLGRREYALPAASAPPRVILSTKSCHRELIPWSAVWERSLQFDRACWRKFRKRIRVRQKRLDGGMTSTDPSEGALPRSCH